MRRIAFSSARQFRGPSRTAFATIVRGHGTKLSQTPNALRRSLPRLFSVVGHEEDIVRVPKKFKPYPFQVRIVMRKTESTRLLFNH